VKESTLEHELQLLKGLARNEQKAAEEIYRHNYNLIQALIVNNSGTAEDARDIFQEAMVVLFEKARSGNFELNCQIRTYLYSVSRRLWLKKLQQNHRYATDLENTGDEVPVESDLGIHEQKEEEYKLMHEAIGTLGEPCKSLLEAFYFKKKNMQEIAESFGYTNAENAKTQKYKCLTRLKKIFFSQYKKQTE
jgi:RNA polymerase sigma factor (sigma-70 family)